MKSSSFTDGSANIWPEKMSLLSPLKALPSGQLLSPSGCAGAGALEHLQKGKVGTVFGGEAEVGIKIEDLLKREAKF